MVNEIPTKVKLIPKSKRAKDRINSHGKIMTLKESGLFRGRDHFFVESLEKTFRTSKDTKETWSGWFKLSEATFEIQNEEK